MTALFSSPFKAAAIAAGILTAGLAVPTSAEAHGLFKRHIVCNFHGCHFVKRHRFHKHNRAKWRKRYNRKRFGRGNWRRAHRYNQTGYNRRH